MIKALRTIRVQPSLPDELSALGDLAANLRWAWHAKTQDLFRWIDAATFEQVRANPVALLGRISQHRIAELMDDSAFLGELAELRADLERYLTQPRWAQTLEPAAPRVAYFSPEFGITHAMQVYSGGLGILAGDHLKAASDLGLEMVGVGLLYRHGYFRQHLDADGWQQERYPDLNPYTLPLQRLERDGEPALVTVRLAGREVACQIWKADVGRVPLLLLDTDVPSNDPADRVVTDRLYGGDVEHRIRQEIVLGIAGTRALDVARELGAIPADEPQIFHSNEGHAGFLQLERIRRLVTEGLGFDEAIEAARARVLFTTHTPVPAGIDIFPRDLMARYFTDFAADCGIDLNRLMAVGQVDVTPGGGDFNMAVMGLRLSATANGVSKLHGEVSRGMFARLWPGVSEAEVPITSVTNGVHAATWIGSEMRDVYERQLGADWRHNPSSWGRAVELPDDVLWRARERARDRLVARVRVLVREQHERRGESPGMLSWTDEVLDPQALTIGFARRFAEYKRGTLLLRQPDRLRAMLTSTDRPVQFVFAGKAHPRDDLGKSIIRDLVHFSGDPELRTRIVFVEDYDMDVAAVLYSGVDIWLNNPRRPYEACGTSGEKAVLNGALHCSTLDGWWDEMYDGENGFAIGSAAAHEDVAHQDAADAESLFTLLERTIVPMFYEREGALPRRWLDRVRRSIAVLGPQVLASRMVREYTTELYRPIAVRAERLTGDGQRRARDLSRWRGGLRDAWHGVEVRAVEHDEHAATIGEERLVAVQVRLGGLTPDDVDVQLLHGSVGADGTLQAPQVESLSAESQDAASTYRYHGAFACATAGEYGVAVRVVPRHEDLLSWADTGCVHWASAEAAAS